MQRQQREEAKRRYTTQKTFAFVFAKSNYEGDTNSPYQRTTV
jgi:hypothetical protein